MIKTTLAYKEAAKENGILHHEVRIEFQDESTITVDDMDIFHCRYRKQVQIQVVLIWERQTPISLH